MSVNGKLTDEQKKKITEIAIETAYEDAMQNNDYLYNIVSQWVKKMNTQDQIYVISSDEDMLQHVLPFDPSTAKKWEEED